MKLKYRNNQLEGVLIIINALAALLVAVTFVFLFGFYDPLVPAEILYTTQTFLLCILIAEKVIRFFNSLSKAEYFRANWFELILLLGLVGCIFGTGRWLKYEDAASARHIAIGAYLVLQVMIKVCRTTVNMAASGRNPTKTLIISFVVLILTGASILMLPRASASGNIGFVDAIFTATSATCVTGLVVKDTGEDFSLLGQLTILTLIQLGGLGIVIFGAVLALLLGQALNVRESVAMQDLLNTRILGRIGNMIGFIFVGTLLIEGIGALSLYSMWDNIQAWNATVQQRWFFSIFHSVSAFCNAGFSLLSNSFISYHRSWQIYLVICPLIIIGGLGFTVLYDLTNVGIDGLKRFFRLKLNLKKQLIDQSPKRLCLQSKIVLCVSFFLILAGAALLMFFEHYAGRGSSKSDGMLGAFFQSVTARTAGFNTVDISLMSGPSKFVLTVLMFIGGSPGSTAGGIKTVTFAVLVMTVVAALRKREEVEIFKRSIRLAVVGRAVTVVFLFGLVLFAASVALSITEDSNRFGFGDILFETVSALGTVGLSTGITSSLTSTGKWIIIFVMLIGRLGPLTLLASLTFNLKPVRYNYPNEAIIVG